MPEFRVTQEVLKRLQKMTPDAAAAYLDGLQRDAMFEALQAQARAEDLNRMTVDELTERLRTMPPMSAEYRATSQRLGEVLKMASQDAGRAQVLEAARKMVEAGGVPNGDKLAVIARQAGFVGDVGAVASEAWNDHQQAQAAAQAPVKRTRADILRELAELDEGE